MFFFISSSVCAQYEPLDFEHACLIPIWLRPNFPFEISALKTNLAREERGRGRKRIRNEIKGGNSGKGEQGTMRSQREDYDVGDGSFDRLRLSLVSRFARDSKEKLIQAHKLHDSGGSTQEPRQSLAQSMQNFRIFGSLCGSMQVLCKIAFLK